MVSKVLCLVLALVSAALGNPVETTVSTTTGSTTHGSNSRQGSTTSPGYTSAKPALSDDQIEKVCAVLIDAPLCSTVGAADGNCKNLSIAANGTAAQCVAPNVCAFCVPAVNGSNPAAGNATSTTSTSTSTTTTSTSTTTTPASTTAHTFTTPLSFPVDPNTVYVSWAPIPSNTIPVKTCQNGKTTFVGEIFRID